MFDDDHAHRSRADAVHPDDECAICARCSCWACQHLDDGAGECDNPICRVDCPRFVTNDDLEARDVWLEETLDAMGTKAYEAAEWEGDVLVVTFPASIVAATAIANLEDAGRVVRIGIPTPWHVLEVLWAPAAAS